MPNSLFLNKIVLLSLIVVLGCSNSNNEKQENEDTKEASIQVGSNKLGTVSFKGQTIQIPLPDDWKKVDSVEGQNISTYVANCPDSVTFCQNLNIRFLENNEYQLDEVVQLFANSMQQKHGNNIEFISVRDQKVDGQVSKDIDFKLFENGVHLGGTTIFVPLNNTDLMIISFMAENKDRGYAQHRRMFQGWIDASKIVRNK